MDVKQAAQQELMRRKARAEIERRAGGQPQQAPQMQEGQPVVGNNAAGAFGRGMDSGFMFGFDDEIGAGMMAPIHAAKDFVQGKGFNLGDNYQRLQQQLDAEKGHLRKQNPVASIAGEVVGGMGAAGKAAKHGLTLAGRTIPKVGSVGKAGIEAGTYGALYGAGEADAGEKLKGAAIGGATGAVLGAGMQKAGNAISSALKNKAAAKVAPTVDSLKQKSSALYTKMRDSGLVVREAKINNIKGNIALTLGETSPNLSPKSFALKDLIEDTFKGDVNIIDLHNISKSVNRISRSNLEGDDKYFVGKIKNFVDSAIDNMEVSDVKGPLQSLALKKEADQLWKTARKSELIEDMFEKAQNQATGFENGIVIQFRSMANNAKKMKQFSPEEQKMIKDLVRRGSVRGILRAVGMLSPNSTFGGLATGGAMVGSGVIPGAAMAGVGYGARKGAEAMTRGKANAIRTAVLTGQAPAQVSNKSARYLIPSLSQQSANQTSPTTTSNRTTLPNQR